MSTKIVKDKLYAIMILLFILSSCNYDQDKAKLKKCRDSLSSIKKEVQCWIRAEKYSDSVAEKRWCELTEIQYKYDSLKYLIGDRDSSNIYFLQLLFKRKVELLQYYQDRIDEVNEIYN